MHLKGKHFAQPAGQTALKLILQEKGTPQGNLPLIAQNSSQVNFTGKGNTPRKSAPDCHLILKRRGKQNLRIV